jgi:hypothetical protein
MFYLVEEEEEPKREEYYERKHLTLVPEDPTFLGEDVMKWPLSSPSSSSSSPAPVQAPPQPPVLRVPQDLLLTVNTTPARNWLLQNAPDVWNRDITALVRQERAALLQYQQYLVAYQTAVGALPPPSSSTTIQSLKYGVNHLIDNHSLFHMVKLSQDADETLEQQRDIFELSRFKKIRDKIEEQRQRVLDIYNKKKEELESKCDQEIQRIMDQITKTMMSHTSGGKGLDLDSFITSRKPYIDKVVDVSSSKQQQIKDDQKKTNGGMKKISKKYCKKNRKSKY